MLNMACCLSSHLRFNHPGKEKKHSAKQGPCGPCGPCGPFSIVINFVSLAVLFSGYLTFVQLTSWVSVSVVIAPHQDVILNF